MPTQKTLKDFVYPHTLHAFQDVKFYDGIFRVSRIFGYKVTLQLQDFRTLFKLGRITESVIDCVIEVKKGGEELE
ncbi:MAG: DUF2309 family protein [Chitinophagaceae bacterium]|nr:DUF2309 family protein [Chitinophagaceae bacterium]